MFGQLQYIALEHPLFAMTGALYAASMALYAAAWKSTKKAVISVNDPMSYSGWTLYQVNYNPEDPTYSGLEAVYDPGVAWVFFGFFLISLGVAWMFYVEPRLKKKAAAPAAA